MALDDRPGAAVWRPPIAAGPSHPGEIRVEVVLDLAAHHVERCQLRLPAGSTAADALGASGLIAHWDAAQRAAFHLGCWGRPCAPDTVLRDLDRVELYRPLQVDPKEARRQRYRRDGMKKGPAPSTR